MIEVTCPHDIVERDIAVSADGYCPLCQTLRRAFVAAAILSMGIGVKSAANFATPAAIGTAAADTTVVHEAIGTCTSGCTVITTIAIASTSYSWYHELALKFVSDRSK
jgi:hypothetical protein